MRAVIIATDGVAPFLKFPPFHLLDLQIDKFKRIHPDEIIIISGKNTEEIRRRWPDFTIIKNPVWETTGSAFDLYWALQSIDDDIIWLREEVLFDSILLRKMEEENDGFNMVAASLEPPVDWKYAMVLNERDFIISMGEKVRNASGRVFPLGLIKKEYISQLLKASRDLIYKNKDMPWTEWFHWANRRYGVPFKILNVGIYKVKLVDSYDAYQEALEDERLWVL